MLLLLLNLVGPPALALAVPVETRYLIAARDRRAPAQVSVWPRARAKDAVSSGHPAPAIIVREQATGQEGISSSAVRAALATGTRRDDLVPAAIADDVWNLYAPPKAD